MADETGTGRLPAGTHIGRTALRVADSDAVTDFYRTVVGLDVLARTPQRVSLGVGTTELLGLEVDETAPDRPQTSAGLYHTAFRVPDRPALADALHRVQTHWRLDGAADHLASEALYLTDPAGNGVEIYRDYPRTDWPTRADGTVRIDTEPLDLDAVAAESAGGPDAPPGTDIGHIHLEVTSLAAFESVYVDGLGFPVQTRLDGALFVGAGGYHHHLGANTWNRRTDPVAGQGLAWFEVVVPDDGALDGVRRRFETQGGAVEPAHDGFTVTDPDGIEIRVRATAD